MTTSHTTSSTAAVDATTGGRRQRSAARIVVILLGAVVGVLGLTAFIGGAVVVAAHSTKRDRDGFYATGTTSITTPTYAFVSDTLDFGAGGPDWLFRQGRLGTIRVTASGTVTKPIFVGIARKAQVDGYLRRVTHDQITDFDVDPFSVSSTRRPGAARPAPPTTEDFWARRSRKPGRGARP
jgi:hypothetical protein